MGYLGLLPRPAASFFYFFRFFIFLFFYFFSKMQYGDR